MSIEQTSTEPTELSDLEQKAAQLRKILDNKKQREQELQKVADNISLLVTDEDSQQQLFERNMDAFKRHFPDIYDFFKEYSPQRYFLDTYENFPNIVDNESKGHLYQYPAYLVALEQVNKFKSTPPVTQSAFLRNDENLGDFIHSVYMNKILDIWGERLEVKKNTKRQLSKHINSMIMFGVGLGYHLELLLGQHDIKNLYLVEPELDVFYASLFTANWQHMLDNLPETNRIHISLGPQDDKFFEDILVRNTINGKYHVMKTFGYVHYHIPSIDELLKEYKNRFFEFIQGWGFFDDAVMSIGHMMTSMRNGVPILKKRSLVQNSLADTPVFIVGNGPSLDGLIDTLREYKDKAVIISCGSALSALYEYGILPDLHCEQERTFPVAEKIDYCCPEDELREIAFFGPSTLHPDVYKKFDTVFMAPKGCEPSCDLLFTQKMAHENFEEHPYINPTVANTAVSVAVGMGFNNLYFFGVDLGHRVEGLHHSEKSMYYDEEGADLDMYISSEKVEFPLKGNFSDDLVSDRFFYTSKQLIERVISRYPELKCYNLSDGVFIKGAHPLVQENIALTDAFSAIENKRDQLQQSISNSVVLDDGNLYQALENELDTEGFDAVCQKLIALLSEPTNTIGQCRDLLDNVVVKVRDREFCPHDHHYLLLEGSIMHIQAMLNNFLYEAETEEEAVSDFNRGVQLYKEFIAKAPIHVKEKGLKPHYNDTNWFEPLRKK